MASKQELLLKFRNTFLTGIITLLPIGVTIWVIGLFLTKVGAIVRPRLVAFFGVFDLRLPDTDTINLLLNILSFAIVVGLITAIGTLSRFFVGRYFIGLADRIVDSVPFVNSIYRTIKQIVDTFSKQKQAVFKETVLVEYPRKNCYALGFLTSTAKGEVQSKTGAHLVNIFVPTTPNPTSGFLLMVPEEEVIPMKMTISDGMKLIISGGAVVPPWDDAKPISVSNPVEQNQKEETHDAR